MDGPDLLGFYDGRPGLSHVGLRWTGEMEGKGWVGGVRRPLATCQHPIGLGFRPNDWGGLAAPSDQGTTSNDRQVWRRHVAGGVGRSDGGRG